MRCVIVICLSAVFLTGAVSGCTRQAPVAEVDKQQAASDAQCRKEMDEIKKSIRGDIKIKLKKDGEGAYSWEISGKDARGVTKTNSILSKKVSAY